MQKEIGVIANYKLTKATDVTLAWILSEIHGYTFSYYLDSKWKLQKKRQNLASALLRNYTGKHRDSLAVREGHNLVPNVLRYSFASLIAGNSVTPTFMANYMALGSGSTAAANTDTELETETLRGAFGERFAIENIAYLNKFFSSTEVGGNSYNEAGVFVDGSAGADTGYLLSRIIINETMASTETLTINASFTIT